MDNPEEGFVRWEKTSTAGEGVALEHALASVLGKDFNYTTPLAARGYIPLEVTAAVIEDGVELVGDQFIRREDSECSGIPVKM